MKERLTASLMKEKIIVIVRGVAAEKLFPLPHLTAPTGSVYVLPGSPAKIILGGRKQIKEAEAALLRRYAPCAVSCVSDGTAASATTAGMLRIYAHKDG